MTSTSKLVLFLMSVWLASCARTAEPPQFPELSTGLEQAQVLTAPDGELLLVWTARGDGGIDLFMSRSFDGSFSEPVRINNVAGSINSITIDEMRPSVAQGQNGEIAVAWTDDAFDIQVAQSHDGGRTFGESIRLNQDHGEALQEFPAIAFDTSGVLHGVWRDPREAGEGLEEPADLYYARVDEGQVSEMNLTGSQESTVCGCCRPEIQIGPDGGVVITFRNTTNDGYRDPFKIVGSVDGRFGVPERVSPPIWQIELCPIAGPIGVRDMTLWLDGSTGYRRLLSAFGSNAAPAVLLEDSDESFLLVPPRMVSGLAEEQPIILVPSDPRSFLMTPTGHSWSVIDDDLPNWSASAAMYAGQLILVGVINGALRQETRSLHIDD